MSGLSDDAVARLRSAASAPDLGGTRYRLVREAGRGGMSTVFLAEDLELGRRVALKVLDVPDDDGGLAERLRREARVLAHLEHPGIAPVHEVGRLPDGRTYYAMKHVEGLRLDAYALSGATVAERLRLFQRVCEAVAFAHDRGVLHRDLKPENVMVGPFGEVLVMDWGLAKVAGDDPVERPAGPGGEPSPEHTAHGAVLGTPGYMAPEQRRGEVDRVGVPADVHALGAVLYHLLARRPPPPDGGPLPPAPGVPGPLLAICAKATAERPEDRYPGALELEADVGRYLEGRRVEAHAEGVFQRAARLYARHRVAFWLIVTYLVVRGALLFFTGR